MKVHLSHGLMGDLFILSDQLLMERLTERLAGSYRGCSHGVIRVFKKGGNW